MGDKVRCKSCGAEFMEDEDFAILECENCGCSVMEVVEFWDE